MGLSRSLWARIVERNAGAGFGMIELAYGEKAAVRDDWGDLEGRVRI